MDDAVDVACWICGEPADSREHIFKRRELRRIFDEDGYAFENLPSHFGGSRVDEPGTTHRPRRHRRINGPDSQFMKYPALICQRCNNEHTARFDRAYDALSDWFELNQGGDGAPQVDLAEVYGEEWRSGVENFRSYCAKALGCRIVASGVDPSSCLPNPLTGDNMEKLRISICRAHPLAVASTYQPSLGERFLGKGALYARLSRRALEAGRRVAVAALWWENVGKFQINYWLDTPLMPELGAELNGASRVYQLPLTRLDYVGMHEAMEAWNSNK